MAKGFTPIIGLAVVVALALAAVFGAMSLADPAAADEHITPAEVDVAVTLTGETTAATNSESSPVALDTAAQFDLTFTLAPDTTYTHTAGDTLEIKTAGVQLPSSFDDGEVRIWVAADTTSETPVDNSIAVRLDGDDVAVSGDMVTIDLPDLTDVDSFGGNFEISGTNVVHIRFTEGAGLETAAAPTATVDLTTDPPQGVGSKDDREFFWSVEGVSAVADGGIWLNATLVAAAPTADGMLDPDVGDPGDNELYTLDFDINSDFNGGLYALTLKFEGFGMPSSISTSSIAIEAQDSRETRAANGDITIQPADPPVLDEGDAKYTFNPATVTVDGKEIIMTIPDVAPEDGITKKSFSMNSKFKVLIYQSAGITNPTEANTYGGPKGTADEDREIFADFGDSGVAKVYFSEMMVPRIVEIDPEDGGLGETVTVTGKGFKDGTTLTVFLDRNRNGNLELGEDELCVALNIGKDDIGTCEFEVTHPTFVGGPAEDQTNYINAVDGRNGYVNKMDDDEFDLPMYELGASINATPKGGSPGEIILIQLLDFPKNRAVTDVKIANRSLDSDAYSATTDSTGAVNFPITIPNWVKAGTQQLKVYAGGENGSQNINLVGPQINATPKTVLANQRISLVGTGFSPGAVIANDTDSLAESTDPVVTIGGKEIVGTRINDSDPVRVDNGGNWSASVDLPLAEATTAEGERALRITDSRGRSGVVIVNIPGREVTVTPENGRVGTLAVIRGSGFPSKNDEGSSFNVQIVYDASNGNTTTVSATPDASGRFEVQLRIPTTAAIPSSNSIKVSFRDEGGVDVVTTVAHDVPEGIITLSETSGGPGSEITVNGEGFKSFVPISLVKIGTLDVTPAPKPATDGNGMMDFGITIPGLDVGIQTIEVHVGRTTASTGFTVTESGVNPGDIKEVAVGLEPLGDNFVSVWHFNNDTKMWSFYTPALEEGNSLTHLITGETYLIRVKSTVEVILNNDTRNLTCVGGNCWNQIVW